MPRRYKKYRRSYKSFKMAKYSNETFCSEIELSSDTLGERAVSICYIVPETNTLGTRKVKNIKLSFNIEQLQVIDQNQNATAHDARIMFALVYVPEGTAPSVPVLGQGNIATSFYEPNQNVIMTGICDNHQIYNFKTRLARNLNSGDSIALVFLQLDKVEEANTTYVTPVTFNCNYAIAF